MLIEFKDCRPRAVTSSELRAVTLSNIMTNSEQKLRKANKELKDEVAELKVELEKVLKELSERTEECNLNVGNVY